jgi:hypothetical protein
MTDIAIIYEILFSNFEKYGKHYLELSEYFEQENCLQKSLHYVYKSTDPFLKNSALS